MSEPRMNQSDDAVRDATGRTWAGWEAALDEAGGEAMSHRELVAWLGDHGGVESSWWRQSVAVGYEKLKGRRVVGQTADGTFQVGVSRTLPVDPKRAWAVLTSPEGARVWLGDLEELRLEEGAQWSAADGAAGEVRVVRHGSHVRLTRDPGGWDRPTTIQVRVEAKDERTVIGFHEENLPARDDRLERRAHYWGALDRLAALLVD